MEAIDHLDLVVTDLSRSHQFYRDPLGPLGCYTSGYYAVFFYDPDGVKLEIVHRPQERDLVRRVDELSRRVLELERDARPRL